MLTKIDVENAIYSGTPITCTREEYPKVRGWLQDYAGRSIDSGDHLRAQIALLEVGRIDQKLDYDPFDLTS